MPDGVLKGGEREGPYLDFVSNVLLYRGIGCRGVEDVHSCGRCIVEISGNVVEYSQGVLLTQLLRMPLSLVSTSGAGSLERAAEES